MVFVTATDYTQFKTLVTALGGNRKTPVVYSTPDGTIIASVDAVIVQLGAAALPSGFATDFPQAVEAGAVGFSA